VTLAVVDEEVEFFKLFNWLIEFFLFTKIKAHRNMTQTQMKMCVNIEKGLLEICSPFSMKQF